MTTTYEALASNLREWGLGELFTVDANGNPTGWLWQQMQAGVDTYEEFVQALEGTDVYRQRFSVIFEQRRQAAAGKPVRVMTPDEVIGYEDTVRARMRQAGLPAFMYDDWRDIQQYAVAGMSVDEIEERIQQGFVRVMESPPAVRDFLNRYYGYGQGDAVLAATFLDPNKVVRDLTRQLQAAAVGAAGDRYGVRFGREAAENVVGLGLSDQEVMRGLNDVSTLAPVFDEAVGERTDLTKEREGVGATLGIDAATGRAVDQGAAARAIQDRVKARTNAFGGGSEALAGRMGVAGLGSAE